MRMGFGNIINKSLITQKQESRSEQRKDMEQQQKCEFSGSAFAEHRAFMDSGAFCKSFFRELLVKTFQGVGLQNAKRMAPKNASLQTNHILGSFTTQGFTQKLQPSIKIKQEKDFKPPVIDNLAVQQIESQKAQPVGCLPQIIQQASSTKSRLKSRKTITQSIRSRKFTQISQQQPQTKSKQLAQFQKLPQINSEFDFGNDPELNKVRANYFNIEKENLERQRQLKSLKEKNLVDRQKNQKIIKDMKRVTYDYEGKLFGQGAGLSQPQKLMSLKNKYGPIAKNPLVQVKPPLESTAVQTNRKRDSKNQKKDYKEAPMFRDNVQTIIETIEVNKGISAGVKIIQQLGDKKSVTKQNPLKKPTIHSLADFKNTTKDSRFREYHPMSLTKQKSSMNVSSINNQQTTRTKHYQQRGSFNRQVKSKSSYSLMDGQKNKSFEFLQDYQSSRMDKSILEEIDERMAQKKVKYRGLPFIKTKGFKAIDIESEKSFKLILDEKGEFSRPKIRNKILINDINLLKLTLEDMS